LESYQVDKAENVRKEGKMGTEVVYLRALEPEDYLTSYKWRNDHESVKFAHAIPRYVSKETERKWVLKAIDEHESGKVVRLAICKIEDNEHIGYIYLKNIDHKNQSCAINILIEASYQKKNQLATEAILLLLKYAFTELGLRRVKVQLNEQNQSSILLWEEIGFQYEATLRSSLFRQHQFQNELIYSLLAEDYLEKYHPEK
jgi:RimJ/RimL family protein N-acetyltransferase